MTDEKPTDDPNRYALEPGKDRVIDLTAMTKTDDPELSRLAQGFFDVAATTWFKWLGWLFAAGGVAYLAEITGDRVLSAVSVLSQLLLAVYAQFFAISIRVEPFWSRARASKSKWRRALSFALQAVIILVVFLAIRYGMEHVIDLIVESRRSGTG